MAANMFTRVAHTLRQPAVKRMLVGSTLIALSYYNRNTPLTRVLLPSPAFADSKTRVHFAPDIDMSADPSLRILYLIHDSQVPTQQEFILEAQLHGLNSRLEALGIELVHLDL